MLLAPLWQIHTINRGMPQSHNDLLPRWVGIRAAFRGEDPYSAGVLREIQTAYYGRPLTSADAGIEPQGFYEPAYAVILLGPFALLPWNAARLAFLVIAPLLLAGGLWLCIREFTSSSRVAWIATTLTFASWPVMWALRLQQLTLFTAAFVFLAYFLIVRGHDIPAGALLAAATFKPQLVDALILWLGLWALLQRRYRLLGSFICAITVLLIPTEIVVPNWFPRWVHYVAAYPHNGNTALPLVLILGRVPGLLFTLALVFMSALVLWSLRFATALSPSFGFAFSLLLATALCVTPTKLPVIYNQVLLAPAAVVLASWKPASCYSGLVRSLTIVAFGWGFASVLFAVVGEGLWGPSGFLMELPFQVFLVPMNYLLPVVATLALLIQHWDLQPRTSSTHPQGIAVTVA
ncbi:MAG: DUF2029 domain-containing protein [Acidobacteriaceae bacterium]|nr:DUF2029 domain-containing protein [Acidobacteriaceae bacterium]